MFRIDKENDEAPLAEVTFEKGSFAGQHFSGELIPCRDLTCQCDKIYVQFKGGDQTFDLWLDTYNHRAEATSEAEQVQSFAGSLTGEISQEDWVQLQQLYYVFKLAGTEMVDPATIEADFNEDEVEEGVMVSYNELLPYGLQIEFSHGEHKYEVDTLYCVRPNCGCTDINLLFHAHKEGEPVDGTESPLIAYDYVTGKHSVESRGQNIPHPPEELLRELKAHVPALDKVLKERHIRFKAMYRGYLNRNGIRVSPRLSMGRTPVMIPAVKQVGRNEPCPCGSGKKFKKCCGA
jgi:hypothetical protein